ncbi:hypothetical protein D3C81_1145440 [compost metagenome]
MDSKASKVKCELAGISAITAVTVYRPASARPAANPPSMVLPIGFWSPKYFLAVLSVNTTEYAFFNAVCGLPAKIFQLNTSNAVESMKNTFSS